MKRVKYFPLIALIMILAACPQDPAKLFQEAEANRKIGQFDKAIEQYQKVIEKQPVNTAAHIGLALAFLEKGNKAEAKNSLNSVIKLGEPPELVSQANEKLGDMAVQEGDPAGALVYYRNVSGVNAQKILNTRIQLVNSLLIKGDNKAGGIELMHLIKDYESNPGVQNLLSAPILKNIYKPLRTHFINEADTQLKAGKFDVVLTLLAKSQRFAPAESQTENKANELGAIANSELGNCGPAAKLWASVTASASDKKPEANYYDIVCALKTKKYLDALKRFEAVANTDPFYSQAQNQIPEVLKLIETKRFKVHIEQANVRPAPNTNQKQIETLTLAKEVRVIEMVGKTGWYRINYNGQRSAFMHSSVITERPLAINIVKSGWEQTKGEGWMLAFEPVVEIKLINLSTKPVSSIQVKMIIKQGSKTFSSDVFNIEMEKDKYLIPDELVVEKITGTVKQELLTRPDEAVVIIFAAVDNGEFFQYRQFYLTRQLVDEKG